MIDFALSSNRSHVALLLSSRLNHLSEDILTVLVEVIALGCGRVGRKLDAYAWIQLTGLSMS